MKKTIILFIILFIAILSVSVTEYPDLTYTANDRANLAYDLKNIFIYNLDDIFRQNKENYCEVTFADKKYYFSSANVTTNKNDDILTLKTIVASGTIRLDINWYNSGQYPWFRSGSFTNKHSITISLLDYFNRSGLETFKDWSWEESVGFINNTFVGGSRSENIDRSLEYSINDEIKTDTVILKDIFQTFPASVHTVSYYNWWEGAEPIYKEDYWDGTSNTIYYYKASDPKPCISFPANGMFYNNKIFLRSILTPMYFQTKYGVKIFAVKIYKKQFYGGYDVCTNSKGQNIIYRYLTDKDELEIKRNGLKNFEIKEDVINDFLMKNNEYIDGEYFIYLGIVDKFNKMYFFEPKQFIVDNTPPRYIDYDLTDDNVFVGSDAPKILTINGISDNFPENMLQKDFVKVKLSGSANSVLIDEAVSQTGEKIFQVENYQSKVDIKLNTKNVVTIEKLFLTDLAGNDSEENIIENRSFVWDVNPPSVTVTSSIKNVYGSSDYIRLEVNDYSKVRFNEIRLEVFYNGQNKRFNIPVDNEFKYPVEAYKNFNLECFDGIEGVFHLYVDVEDVGGNKRIYNPLQPFYYKTIDAKPPDINIYINGSLFSGEEIKLNKNNLLFLNVTKGSDISHDIKITSNISNSTNVEDLTNRTEENFYKNLVMNGTLGEEVLDIVIKARDRVNTKEISKRIYLYNDISSPSINITNIDTGRYNIKVADDCSISRIYIKYINGIDSINYDNFKPAPDNNSTNNWQILAENVLYFTKNINILPGFSAYIIAEDIWGNKNVINNPIMKNDSAQSDLVINSKTDLDNCNWTLYGNVLFRTSIDILENETLKIITVPDYPTKITFDSSIGEQIKLVIQGGNLSIDSSNSTIDFIGSGGSDFEYKWFGIQLLKGSLNFIGSYRVSFINGVAPLSYYNSVNNISLNNLNFDDCLMGIHFIDSISDYNTLEVSNSIFNNLIYGIKFEIDSYNEDFSVLNYLIKTGNTFTNIIKGNIYDPVNGLSD